MLVDDFGLALLFTASCGSSGVAGFSFEKSIAKKSDSYTVHDKVGSYETPFAPMPRALEVMRLGVVANDFWVA